MTHNPKDQSAEATTERAWRAFRDSDKPAPWNQIKDALAALTPGDRLPGGLVVTSERLLKLLHIKYGPWSAYKAALLEEVSGDALSGFNVDKEIERAMIEASHD